MNYSLKRILIIFISFSIFAGTVNLLIITSSYSNKNEHEFWLIHTYEVLDLVSQLKVQVKRAETGQRGYLLTEDREYLVPYKQGINLSLNTYEALKIKTKDNPTQQKRLTELYDILNQKFSELEQTIQFAKKGAMDEAKKLVKTDIGRHLMEEIELVLLAFEQEERYLLNKRSRDYIEAKSLHSTSVIILECVYIILIVWLIYSIRDKVLKPLRVLGLYIKNYPESEKFEIAKDNNCIEVSELAQGIKSRCSESEKAIIQLKQNEQEMAEQLKSVTQRALALCSSNEHFTAKLSSMLQQYFRDKQGAFSHEDIDHILKLTISERDSNKELELYLKNNINQSDKI
ncbi:hypothetical protein N476_07135 [Pseudoalteromonas luteoviolacea H33]|uniref:CHASE3 domain-containing protein n=1 Tax=Pseudoalteromonas luteoviolacea H33 TaxID=1365251 RepID=A0A167GIP3_9GAMM|nr:hypothetical protein N476_07135 [Pseudoalteromonas luteoviolacea H33]KZN74486.1 hypothetical protein N477_22165 [Pseudoalteromonas luteoviolacea H33-S]